MDVEWVGGAFLDHQHSGKAAAECVSEFKKAIRAHPGNVSQNDPAPMQFGEDFLIDARMLIFLMTIDYNHAVTEFPLYNRLNNNIKKSLHVSVIRMIRIQ